MSKIKFVLSERYINLFRKDSDKREKYVDEVWEILQSSYKKIGGIKGSGFETKEDMIKKLPMWKLYVKDGKVKFAAFYKDKQGRKGVAMGTDGSREAKLELKKFVKDEFATKRAWKEVSHAMLNFIKNLFTEEELQQIAIPVDKVKELLPDEDIIKTGEYTYVRYIGDEPIEKMALGTPNVKFK